VPNSISLLPANFNQVPNDPTKQINGDPMGFVGDNPFLTMTEDIIFGAANTLIEIVDYVTGLDLLPAAKMLEDLLGSALGGSGASGFASFLDNQPSTDPTLGLPTPSTSPVGLFSGIISWITSGFGLLGGGGSLLGSIIGVIPGIVGGLTGLTGLGSIFGDLFGLLGGPTGVGSGSPVLPIIGSIPILGPLLSGGITILGSLIPGLDASKIVSGTFGAGLLQPFIDAVSQGFGGTTGLGIPGLQSFLSTLSLVGVAFDDIISLIPGIGSGLSGSTGLGSIFTDWLGLLGSPTGLGTGSASLPGIGSIPILGGLLSGGISILGSLIPGLDASKIISGTFGASILQPVIDAVSQGFGGSTGLGFGGLTSFLGGLSFGGISFDDLIALIPGIGTGLSGSTGLGSIFTDLFGLLGSPTAVGSGSPVLPVIGSIPILGPLLSGGVSILGSLIPGLDASKIVSGAFPISMITSLATLLGGFGTGSSILTQLIGIIPGIAGGLTGLTGLGSIFTDLFGIVGSPTAVGSGTPVLPGISSIPILGGLLSGGTSILGSLIPGLDASKIVSGTFPLSMVTSLVTLFTGFGTGSSILTQLLGTFTGTTGGLSGLGGLTSIFTDLLGIVGSPTALGSGSPVLPGISSIPVLGGLLSGGNILGSIIPGLDASKITSGSFGTGLIPGLDASKIVSGLFPTSLLGNILNGGLTSILSSFIPSLDASKVTTGTFGAGLIPSLDASKITTGVFSDTVSGVANVWSTLTSAFGSTGSTQSAASSAATTLNNKVTALIGGGVLTQYTTNATWTKPTVSPSNGVAYQPDDLFTVICICGGNGGGRGSISMPFPGGLSGGYVSQQFKYSALPATVAMTIGAAGAGATANSTVGGSGGSTSFGSLVVGQKGAGSILKTDGSYATAIPPGDGGDGGSIYFATTSTPGTSGRVGRGKSSSFAAGGEVGASTGGNGAAAPAGTPAGGGGGAGANGTGTGGAGGFPGGAGGGGGVGGTGTTTNGGAGAAGCIYVIAPY
jgi:hypothetical protein